jgi:hypothetical protein
MDKLLIAQALAVGTATIVAILYFIGSRVKKEQENRPKTENDEQMLDPQALKQKADRLLRMGDRAENAGDKPGAEQARTLAAQILLSRSMSEANQRESVGLAKLNGITPDTTRSSIDNS